jgi:glycosyltransferase involved in cell wall biosynthesis
MKRDVLFLCQFFYPEYNSSATLPFDTARYLAQSGYSVDALCGYPREYNTSGEVSAREMKDGVSIHRLHYIQFSRRSKLGRLINYFSFTLSVLLHIFEIKNYKTVIVYSNPPVLPIAAIWANRLFNTKIIFVSYDVYPEVAYASGSLSPGGAIAQVMRGINRSLFKRADAVVALTDEMREFLLRNRPELSEDRVVTIANWAHEAPSEGAADARRKLGYAEDDFVVSYFGNLGVCQDETALIQAMELLKDRPHIKFMVAGHGSKLPLIRQAAEHLPNVRICGFLTGAAFGQAVAASSCGIVSLERGLMGMCAPSKYYSYLQGGLPVLTVAEKESYLAEESVRQAVGLFSETGDGAQLAQNILSLYQSPEMCGKMSKNALMLYTGRYAKSVGLARYAALFEDIFPSAN